MTTREQVVGTIRDYVGATTGIHLLVSDWLLWILSHESRSVLSVAEDLVTYLSHDRKAPLSKV